MNLFFILIISFSAFSLGYTLGNGKTYKTPKKRIDIKPVKNDEVCREFINFLNYDGSEQE